MRVDFRTTDAPNPRGPYSQAVRIGTTIACSGQTGTTAGGELVDGVAAQTHQALANITAALSAAGAGMGDVLHARVYLTDPADFEAMNGAYADHFTAPFPARTTVFVGLPPGMLVEIDALAATSETTP